MRSFFTRLSFPAFIFLTIVSSKASAQILLNESFENVTIPNPPPGWVVQYTNHAHWLSLDGNQYDGNVCMYLAGSYYGDQSDAWLMTPSVNFEAGKKYSISFYYKNQSFQKNRLQVTVGDDTTAISQTEILWNNTFETDYYSKAQVNYTATSTGAKHIGIHCITPKTWTYIYINKMGIQEGSCFERFN